VEFSEPQAGTHRAGYLFLVTPFDRSYEAIGRHCEVHSRDLESGFLVFIDH